MKKYLTLVLTAAAFVTSSLYADVNILFDQASYNANPGGTFNVTVQLQITGAEQVNGVNYFLEEDTSSGFSITARSTTGSSFSDSYFSDAQVSSSLDNAAPAGADNALNSINDLDLGATTATGVFVTSSGSPHFLATFTLMAPTAPGMYTLDLTTVTGIGYANTANQEVPFNNTGSANITVVPEPTTWALLGFGGLGALGMTVLRRRRK